ncbi:MAG TPA: hypothetical protein V6C78_29240, partial [Crinalium sp.]
MLPQDITPILTTMFGTAVQASGVESWQVELGTFRLLVLLSDDRSWLRSLISIAPAQEARPYLEQLLEANFDETQETRYAIHQGILWGVFQHSLEGLSGEDFQAAIARLISLQEKGLSQSFSQLAESQIRQIIYAAKRQGQSIELTLQNLERFYQEGLMGDMDQNAQQRQSVLDAWRYQLERLWNEVEL